MWDFDSVATDKLPAIDSILKPYKSENSEISQSDISTTEKLLIAQKIYSLYDVNDEFWCEFYRILAYHYDEEENPEKAKEARLKAIEFADKILKNEDYKDLKKPFYFIKAGLYYYLNDFTNFELFLEKTLDSEYRYPEYDDEKNEQVNNHFDNLVEEFKEKRIEDSKEKEEE